MNDRAVDIAREWIGTPFRKGAKVKGQGVDCLQLLVAIYEELTGHEIRDLPAYNVSWYESSHGEEVYLNKIGKYLMRVGSTWDDAQPGDALLFRMKLRRIAKHSAILASSRTMIHSVVRSRVSEVSAADPMYRGKLVAVFRFPEAN